MPRQTLTPGRLYSLLARELSQRRPEGCMNCRMPLPFSIARGDDAQPNWRIGTPNTCEHGCDAIIHSIVDDAAPDYDLHDPSGPVLA